MGFAVATFCVCVTLIYLWHRGGLALLRDWLVPGTAPVETASVTVPLDLEAEAMAHSEKWAQDDLRTAMLEEYAEKKDWNLVRAKFGVPDPKGVRS